VYRVFATQYTFVIIFYTERLRCTGGQLVARSYRALACIGHVANQVPTTTAQDVVICTINQCDLHWASSKATKPATNDDDAMWFFRHEFFSRSCNGMVSDFKSAISKARF
jgi:hypothetical protein